MTDYNEHDHIPGQDDISDQDIRDVIEEMIEDGTLAPSTSAYGIAQLFADTLDYAALSEKQKFVFERDIKPELVKRSAAIGIRNHISRYPE